MPSLSNQAKEFPLERFLLPTKNSVKTIFILGEPKECGGNVFVFPEADPECKRLLDAVVGRGCPPGSSYFQTSVIV